MREFHDPESRSSCGATHVPGLRFWIAAWYTKLFGYYRKRFWKTTCSRRTTIYSLQHFKQLCHHPLRNWGLELPEWNEKRDVEDVDFITPLPKWKRFFMFILSELILTVVKLIIRDFRFRKCIWEHFQTHWNFKAGKSTSRMRYLQEQPTLRSQCTGSKKLRLQSQ